MSDTCPFCSPGDPTLHRIIARADSCYARLDNFPLANGHLQVVPLRHVESFFDLTPAEVADAYGLLQLARDLTAPADGYNIGVNEGRAAGRTIDHLHIHLIPRRYGDVPDPRGGIRCVLSRPSPDAWAPR